MAESLERDRPIADAAISDPLQLVISACNSLASGSPKRRKAPIDIDAALRLQSQASYVQEPARGSFASAATSASSLNIISGAQSPRRLSQLQSAQQSATSGPGPLVQHATAAPGAGGGQADQASGHLGLQLNLNSGLQGNNAANTSNQRNQTEQQQHGRQSCMINASSYYDCNYFNSSNISVDYIDCLSNNDLIGGAPSPGLRQQLPQQEQQQQHYGPPLAATSGAATRAGTVMRGIPSCRKHLSRFHRSHRVEPNAQVVPAGPVATSSSADSSPAAEATNANLNLQQQQSSNNNNDSNSMITSEEDFTSVSVSANLTSGDQLAARSATVRQSSVLYPISVNEAKKRTYFIGSVCQDSLLSHDELYRYFPNGRVSIFVCTWNQNRKRAPINLNDLLLPDQLIYLPDIYAIGIQEAYSSQQDYLREWEIELQTTLGPNHVLLHSCSLGTLHLAVFIRRDLIWFCSTPEESLYNSRSMPTNMIKTKGAVSIAFRFFGTSFMFTNCHFPAHENKLRDRIDEYQRIINSIDLPKNLKILKARYLSNDSTARFDCVFFLGDLNFRLEQRTFDETIQILEDIFQSREQNFEPLTQNDELLKVMESQQAFHGFDESQIKFPPTYKFLAQTNKYDRQTKRVPSYTDRILFRSKRQRHIQCLIYDWLPQLLSSDHKPVYSLFDVQIRPGHEQNMVNSLNAGLFQRTVYMEALRRRAEDSDGIRENGASGNLICSVS